MSLYNTQVQKPQFYMVGIFIAIVYALMTLIPLFTDSSPFTYIVQIDSMPFHKRDYYNKRQILFIDKKEKLSEEAFIDGKILIQEAKRLGFTASKNEVISYLNNSIDLLTFIQALELSNKPSDKYSKEKVLECVKDEILEEKIRKHLQLALYKDKLSTIAPTTHINLREIDTSKISFKSDTNPQEKALKEFYEKNKAQYSSGKGYAVQRVIIDCSSKKTIEELEKRAEALYKKEARASLKEESRKGYIIKLPDEKSEKELLQALDKGEAVPIHLNNYITEMLSGEYDTKYSNILFTLNEKSPYKQLEKLRYIVLESEMIISKLTFQQLKAALTEQACSEDVLSKTKEIKKQAATLKGINELFETHKKDVVSVNILPEELTAFDQEYIIQDIKNRKDFGFKEISYNVFEIFKVVKILPDTPLEFFFAINKVKTDYIRKERELRIVKYIERLSSNTAKEKVWDKKDIYINRFDSILPNNLLSKIFTSPINSIDFVNFENKYYIFQRLAEITPILDFSPKTYLRIYDPFYEKEVLNIIKKKHDIRIKTKEDEN